jgi:acyl carrier protein
MTDTFERLRVRLHRDFDMPLASLVPEATLESLEVDSLRMIEVLFGIEEEFGLSTQEDADHNQLRQRLRTLADLASYIDELRQAKAAG